MQVEEIASVVCAASDKSKTLLRDAKAMVEGLGFTVTVNDGLHCIERRIGTNLVAECYVVPAEEVLACLEAGKSADHAVRRLHSELYERRNEAKVTAQVFLLGTDDFFAEERVAVAVSTLCYNENFGVKYAGNLERLQAHLAPAFPPATHAHPPCLYTGPVHRMPWMKPEPDDVVAALTNRDAQSRHTAAGLDDGTRMHIAAVYERILDSGRVLQFSDDDVLLGWPCAGIDTHEGPNGIPLAYCSNGERTLFGLAHFLVTQYSCAKIGATVCVDGVLSQFATVLQSKILDTLVEFCAATGMNLYLKSPQSALCSWARRKFETAFQSPDKPGPLVINLDTSL